MTFRVSKDTNDKAYSESAWKRRVWYKDQEVPDWITADEFRRMVSTPNGVLNGAVRIERLPEDAPPVDPPKGEVPIDAGFSSGVFVNVPDQPNEAVEKAVEAHGAHEDSPVPQESAPPEVPDASIDDTQSTRLPVGTTQV